MTDRPRLDQLTDDMLDQLYAHLEHVEQAAGRCFEAAHEKELDRWRHRAEQAEAELAENVGVIQALRRQRDDAEAAIARVRALHAPGRDWSWKPFGCEHHGAHAQPCAHCGVCSPCPTLHALDGTA